MASCQEFPTSESIFITTEEEPPVTVECKKNSKGDYFCRDRPIQDGFWKLIKGDNNVCRWYKCQKPYRVDKNGSPVYKPDGTLDTSDFSDCVMTNYPYYIKNAGDSCSVRNIFTGETEEDECQTVQGSFNEQCCTKDEVCSSTDCMGYRPTDRFLVSGSLDYDCKDGSCVPVMPGKGKFTNPFCDYQCGRLLYPKNFTCLNGYCQQVADTSDDTKTYYDNPFCDDQCPMKKDATFDCDKTNKICKYVEGGGGEYKNYADCYDSCFQDDSGIFDIPGDKKPVEPVTKLVTAERITLIVLVVLLNIIVIGAAVYFFNKIFENPKDVKQ